MAARVCVLAFSDHPSLVVGNSFSTFDAQTLVVFDSRLMGALADLPAETSLDSRRPWRACIPSQGPLARLRAADKVMKALAQAGQDAHGGFIVQDISSTNPAFSGIALGVFARQTCPGFSERCLQRALSLWEASDPVAVPLGPWRATFDGQGFANQALLDFALPHWQEGKQARDLARELRSHALGAPPSVKAASL